MIFRRYLEYREPLVPVISTLLNGIGDGDGFEPSTSEMN